MSARELDSLNLNKLAFKIEGKQTRAFVVYNATRDLEEIWHYVRSKKLRYKLAGKSLVDSCATPMEDRDPPQ